MIPGVTVQTSPSLALIKYWGKKNIKKNTAATSSLALTLDQLKTTTVITEAEQNEVILNGLVQNINRFIPFFNMFKKITGSKRFYKCESENNFPSAAGLASSSSGFAALAFGLNELAASGLSINEVSSLARLGSASAARAVFGGITILPQGADYARQIYSENYWPELSLLVLVVSNEQKKISSRKAMESSRLTSPYYKAWVKDSKLVFKDAVKALEFKDLEKLGSLMRNSYLRMFSTMFSAEPPVIYWRRESTAIINICEELRNSGIGVWETMDAGPQVKMLCLKDDTEKIKKRIGGEYPGLKILETKIGSGPSVIPSAEETGK